MKILITGASGNVGSAVVQSLLHLNVSPNIIIGERGNNVHKTQSTDSHIQFRRFDFTDISTFQSALSGIDYLFLLRPPQIADVPKYFKPLIDAAKETNIKHIVFLSVQGVENNKMIPHYKIEQLIVASNIPFTFLRPAYFMQNFTTTLKEDLLKRNRIFLPAGNAKFTLIDVDDIGKVAAKILSNPQQHINTSYELTSKDKLTFSEMADDLSSALGRKIEYISPNLIRFILAKRKERLPITLIMVMIMLHYLPRFQREPRLTSWVKDLTGDDPISFVEFCKTIDIKE